MSNHNNKSRSVGCLHLDLALASYDTSFCPVQTVLQAINDWRCQDYVSIYIRIALYYIVNVTRHRWCINMRLQTVLNRRGTKCTMVHLQRLNTHGPDKVPYWESQDGGMAANEVCLWPAWTRHVRTKVGGSVSAVIMPGVPCQSRTRNLIRVPFQSSALST